MAAYYRSFDFLDVNQQHQNLSFQKNSFGYRCKEFDEINWANSIVLLGCSITLGIGVDDNETIGYRLENLSGQEVINLGISGGSIYHSFFNQLSIMKMNVRPKAIVNVWTSINRLMVFDSETAWCVLPQSPPGSISGNLFLSWNHRYTNAAGYASMIQKSCQIFWKDIPYYECSFFESTAAELEVELLSIVDVGSDNIHPGPRSARLAAEKIAQKLGFK